MQKTEESVDDLIVTIQEFVMVNEFLDDEEVTETLETIMRYLRRPDLWTPVKASREVLRLEALAAKFAVMAAYYRTIGAGSKTERNRKDFYYTMRELLQRLSDAMKYLARV